MPTKRIRSTDVIRQRKEIDAFIDKQSEKAARRLKAALANGRGVEAALKEIMTISAVRGEEIAAGQVAKSMIRKASAADIDAAIASLATKKKIHGRSASWASKQAKRRMKTFTAAERKAVQNVIRNVRRKGLSRGDAKRMLKNVVGLDPRRAVAVSNFEIRAIASGMSPSQASRAGKKYAAKLRVQRATMIARTEMVGALNEGRTNLWKEIAKETKTPQKDITRTWFAVMDERTVDDTCIDLNDTTVALNQSFPGGFHSPPAHPNCRCDLLIEVK